MKPREKNSEMSNTIVVGAQWGDEGKGKIVDYLTENTDVVVRAAGGNNAGHTVISNGQKYILPRRDRQAAWTGCEDHTRESFDQ